ncbi:MAG: prepilin-type N-terminal cleavage/methylation domain-containing protein [Clostridiales bacterium]|jgi:prepilin-type N-terminal cleavage/methylation domain-containing protein|nr:prepilin-type N-terminal cleavage/methylation domain-containing protein [Clostridiales bacterium]
MKKKGFTLIELILSLTLILAVFGICGTVLAQALRASGDSKQEIDAQSKARKAADYVVSHIRASNSLYILPGKAFDPEAVGLDANKIWNYVGMRTDADDDGRETVSLVSYTWNKGTGARDERVLAGPYTRTDISLTFSKNPDPDSKMVTLLLSGNKLNAAGNVIRENWVNIETTIDASNVVMVKDLSEGEGVAVAWSEEKRADLGSANISFVYDISEDMSVPYDGESTPRAQVLNRDMKYFMERFETSTSLWYSLIPYNEAANSVYPFADAALGITDLKAHIDATTASPAGMANPGDGLRRAYYEFVKLKADHPETQERGARNVVILVTCGEPKGLTADLTCVPEDFGDDNPWWDEDNIAWGYDQGLHPMDVYTGESRQVNIISSEYDTPSRAFGAAGGMLWRPAEYNVTLGTTRKANGFYIDMGSWYLGAGDSFTFWNHLTDSANPFDEAAFVSYSDVDTFGDYSRPLDVGLPWVYKPAYEYAAYWAGKLSDEFDARIYHVRLFNGYDTREVDYNARMTIALGPNARAVTPDSHLDAGELSLQQAMIDDLMSELIKEEDRRDFPPVW